MIFSQISHVAILLALIAPACHMAIVSRTAGHATGRTFCILVVTASWTVYAWLAVRTGFDAALLGPFAPARPLVYLLLAAALDYGFRDRLLGNGVSQHVLIGLQLIRPIGLVFVLESSRGTVPGVFAHPAGWGDLAVGIAAAWILLRYRGGHIPERAVITVAALGLLDFASAFFFGFTSSAKPVQLFSHDAPNPVLDYPLGLIPLFPVPYAVVAHILSLTQRRRDATRRSDARASAAASLGASRR